MPWPGHNMVAWGGRRGTDTDEIWQNGVRVCKPENDGETVPWGDEPFDSATDESYCVDLAAWAVRWWFERPESAIASHCMLDWVSTTWITPSGAPDLGHHYRHYYDPPVAGGGAPVPVFPFQVAMVITWRSDVRARGPGSRGRIFSPAPAVLLSGPRGEFHPLVAVDVAQSASRMIEQLAFGNLPTGDRRHPHIVSPSGPGYRSRIDHVDVDTRLDVLRPRAEHQRPFRVSHTVDHDWFDG